jgi:hypothetical protein
MSSVQRAPGNSRPCGPFAAEHSGTAGTAVDHDRDQCSRCSSAFHGLSFIATLPQLLVQLSGALT